MKMTQILEDLEKLEYYGKTNQPVPKWQPKAIWMSPPENCDTGFIKTLSNQRELPHSGHFS